MIYTIIHNNQSYDLPPRTLDVVTKMERAGDVDTLQISTKEKYKIILNAVVDILGKDTTNEILGTTSLEKVDLSELRLTFLKMVDAYNSPIDEYKTSRYLDTLKDIPLEQIKSLIEVSERAGDK